LALDRKRLHDHKQKKATERELEDTSGEGDSDLRYHISASKNNPQDIFSTIRNNRVDPAFYVCFLATNSCKSQLIKFLIFEEIFTEASRPFIRTTNGP
jgi:hypothetical protein